LRCRGGGGTTAPDQRRRYGRRAPADRARRQDAPGARERAGDGCCGRVELSARRVDRPDPHIAARRDHRRNGCAALACSTRSTTATAHHVARGQRLEHRGCSRVGSCPHWDRVRCRRLDRGRWPRARGAGVETLPPRASLRRRGQAGQTSFWSCKTEFRRIFTAQPLPPRPLPARHTRWDVLPRQLCLSVSTCADPSH